MNRAAWPLWSEGAHNPRPDIVFGLPAGCGIELERDPVEVGLATSPDEGSFDLEEAVLRLNAALPKVFKSQKRTIRNPAAKVLWLGVCCKISH